MGNTKDSQDISPNNNECTSYSTHHSETVHSIFPTLPIFSEIEKKLKSLESAETGLDKIMQN